MRKRQENLTIVEKKNLGNNLIYWVLESSKPLEYIHPGQFINIRAGGNDRVLFRRPFSIHEVDYSANRIHFIMKVVGAGTRYLAGFNTGEKLDVLFPLGNGFPLKENGKALLVGGGYGQAPLYHLALELLNKGVEVNFLFGARSQLDLIQPEKFEKLAPYFVTTEDGSKGEKGIVTRHSIWNHRFDFDVVYSCGPEPMMKAVSEQAHSRDVECFVSLDQVMGCGTGVCLGCIKSTKQGNLSTCLHGPVFNAKDIIW